MKAVFALTALALAAGSIAPPAGAQSSSEREQIREIIVYGTDPCPRSTETEVVVCARRPESERYRIPPNLREAPPTPENESWAEKAQALEMVGRSGIQSCSPVGPGGATGCLAELIRKARDERRANAKAEQKVP